MRRRSSKGNGPVDVLDYNQIMELQKLLTRMGYDVGKFDGKLGALDARRGQERADQVRHAGRFLADAGFVGADGRVMIRP